MKNTIKVTKLLWKHKEFTLKLMFFNLLFFIGMSFAAYFIRIVNNNIYVLQQAVQISFLTRVAAGLIVILFYFLIPLILYTLVKFQIIKGILVFFKQKFTLSPSRFFNLNLRLGLLVIIVFLLLDFFAGGMKPGKGFLIFFLASHVILILFFHVCLNLSHWSLVEGQQYPLRQGLRASFSGFGKFWQFLLLDIVLIGGGIVFFYIIGIIFKVTYVQRYGITIFGNTLYTSIFYIIMGILALFALTFNQVFLYEMHRKIK